MLTLSTPGDTIARVPRFPSTATPTAQPKRRNTYHHGNLREALVEQAVATIRDQGVEALTLRDVGARLRVSRTALYRHFADKQALLAAVATQGFRTFRQALIDAWDGTGHSQAGFMQMGRAYVTFARAHPSHYRVMFGGFVEKADCDPDLRGTADSAFAVLVSAIAELQQQGRVRAGDPQEISLFVWASVHGFAMLAVDGQLAEHAPSLDGMTEGVITRVWDAIAARAASAVRPTR